MPTDNTLAEIRRALIQQMLDEGLSLTEFARRSDLSTGGMHDFLNGRRGLGLATWQSLYRTHPELRWLLEQHQRQSALSAEVADGASPRRA